MRSCGGGLVWLLAYTTCSFIAGCVLVMFYRGIRTAALLGISVVAIALLVQSSWDWACSWLRAAALFSSNSVSVGT